MKIGKNAKRKIEPMSSFAKSREETKRYLVVTDGTLTEKTYFEMVNRLARDVILVKKVRHTPELVKIAADMKETGNFDGVFIVCDIDEHCKNTISRSAFETLIADARNNDIEVLCSHECFEVWLLAHKQQVPSEAKSRKLAQNLAEKAGLLVGKNAKIVISKEITAATIAVASQEAKRLRKTYGGNVLDDGPTTDIDRMIDRITWDNH